MSTEMPPPGRDPAASTQLQILATEHWSLLATRSLTYTESLGRVNMFLGILSGAVIALALVAQADHFGTTFITVAILLLSVVLVSGVATVGRLMMLNRDDYRWIVAMNRLRHGYLDLHPELERNFVTSPYDDLAGALQTLGIDRAGGLRLGSLFQGIQSLPGMLSVIVAADAGTIAALAALGFGLAGVYALLTGAAVFVVAMGLLARWNRQAMTRPSPGLDSRFPSPKS
ncbi:MAG TPA: hypothetical protein VGG90_01615 [Candidatus Dormibacteraeota bacterium]|jgi:hypothetical protein